MLRCGQPPQICQLQMCLGLSSFLRVIFLFASYFCLGVFWNIREVVCHIDIIRNVNYSDDFVGRFLFKSYGVESLVNISV